MKSRTLSLLGLALAGILSAPVQGLDITLDSGSGSLMLVDADLDGIIDFNTTVGGVLEARGRVFEQLNANTASSRSPRRHRSPKPSSTTSAPRTLPSPSQPTAPFSP
jgi:hypothetical protein